MAAPPRILLLQSAPHKAGGSSARPVDHFAAIASALRARGYETDRALAEDHAQTPQLPENTGLVAVADTLAPLTTRALRLARARAIPTVLLMDGLLEHRNTFINPSTATSSSSRGFLRPAPVGLVACAGEVDRRILAAMGNHAEATGLPRLTRAARITRAPDASALLIATARTPAFTPAERTRLLDALRTIKAAAEALGTEIIWRLTARLGLDLGVKNTQGPLTSALERAAAVITTPSTLLAEAMTAGIPTAVLHAHPEPLWQTAAWQIHATDHPNATSTDANPRIADAVRETRELERGAHSETLSSAPDLVRSLLAPSIDLLELQERLRLHLAAPPEHAPRIIADLIERTLKTPRAATTTLAPERRTRPGARIEHTGKPRVVFTYITDGQPLGGVPVFCDRIAKAFADDPKSPYDIRTLVVTTRNYSDREGLALPTVAGAPMNALCVVDQSDDHWRRLATVRESLDRLNPDIVCPQYGDLCHAAATQLAAAGLARTIATMQTDDQPYRDAIRTYNIWSAAVGVSTSCTNWLRTIANGRPTATIPDGVPIPMQLPRDDRPDDADAPFRLVYTGRMAQLQKRIHDFHDLIDALEARSINAELHLIGDGPDLDAFLERQAVRTPRTVRVIHHGPRTADEIQDLLPTFDAFIALSESEGCLIAAMEAMAHGLVPVLTRCGSEPERLIDQAGGDRIAGLLAPIGDTETIADKLAWLAAQRSRIRAIGTVARQSIIAEAGMPECAKRWRTVFDTVLAEPMRPIKTDRGLHLQDAWRWTKRWADEPDAGRAWITERLVEAGYTNPFVADGPITPATLRCTEEARTEGRGAALGPTLIEPEWVRMASAALKQTESGRTRIAIFGAGQHTRRAAELFERAEDLRINIVGIIDDNPARPTLFDRPVVTTAEAVGTLNPDAVILSSDAFESALWAAAQPLRAAGVEVVPLYGSYTKPDALTPAA